MKTITKNDLKLLIREAISEILNETAEFTKEQNDVLKIYEKMGYSQSGFDGISNVIQITNEIHRNDVLYIYPDGTVSPKSDLPIK